ncbi:PQQ-binding-like beta-propeller repeat protein [Streptomyces sp. NPDC059875]|uniref:protein kinase domain-containing protein n=1 Tax=unclassified Streptomyces TaxID=2593676 RepID=UPI00365AEAD1
MLSPLTHDDPAAIATYRLLARLGSGGMGTVYLARTPGGRTVALKTMHARLASEAGFRTRFRLETDAARIIGDRHGAAVVDADPLAETPWLATEYVLGPPLDDAVTLCGPLPEPSVRALGAALAGALAQLHSSDVVHRDLKPSNVLVTAYGPKIIDFGIARAAGDDHLTSTGAAAGTPAFMSPEQAGGQEHTPAGDVFALAGVLVFAATGHGPFGTGAPADLLYRVRYTDPDLTGVPEPLLPLLTACLAKDPAARPTTTALAAHLHDGRGEFADHLPPHLLTDIARRATQVWLHHPHRLPPPADDPYAETVAASGPRRPSRRGVLAAGGGALLGLAGLGAGAWAWLGPEDEPSTGGGSAGPEPSSPAPTDDDDPNGDTKSLWQAESTDHEEQVTPLLADGVVGFSESGQFIARSPATGSELWKSMSVYYQQVVTDGTDFFRSRDSTTGKGLQILRISARTGTESGSPIEVPGFVGDGQGTHLLTADGGMLFASARRGEDDEAGWHLLAVNLRTGKEAWRRPYTWDGNRRYVTQVVGGKLILGKVSGDMESLRMEARDARTGNPLWQRSIPQSKTDAWLRPGELALDAQHIYLGGDRLRALRVTDGKIAWEVRRGTHSYGKPAVAEGVVYATEGERGLVAVSADKGAVRWEEQPPARDLTPTLDTVPLVGKRYVYAPVVGGLNAIDLSTRRSAWVFPTDATRYVVDRKLSRIVGAGEATSVAFPYE